MAIYIAKGKKTIDQIKNETGADVIINGGLFNMSNPAIAYCPLKSDGVVYADDGYTYFGYGWHSDQADIRLATSMANLDNYIACDCMIRNGQKETLHVSADRSYACPRTAIGIFPDGSVWFYAEPAKLTPAELQDKAFYLGLDSALLLDGGGSTQGISPSGSYKQSRRCHNYILAWLKETCPYTEPTEELGQQDPSKVKWLQWHLNRAGADLEVDGLFGPLTHAAAVEFMSRYPNITADGVVGPLTRKYLKAYEQPSADSPIEIIKPNYVWRGTPSPRSATNYIILHHAAANCTAMQTHIFHRDTKGWIGIGYNFFVAKDGGIYEGRPIDAIGAHCAGYNNKSVGVCFEGNFETEQMNDAQKAAGRRLVQYLKGIYPSAVVKKHKDLDATACPGKYFPFAEIGG